MVCGVLGLGSGAVRVELLEDDRALVVDTAQGRACTVERWRVPPKAREGDVVVDGVVDLERTERLRQEVATARRAIPVPPGLEL
ncbi:DUF3006 domain-containing protein [Myxococcaceae bacterium JPH2]|nr:DUF3006 domain-containing protein [Myxococcaceae bacterium JPH2]